MVGFRVVPFADCVFCGLGVEVVVGDHAVEELAFYAGGSFESPCKASEAICEEFFDEGFGGELVEEALFAGVELFLGFAFDDVGGGGQAVGGGVLGGFGFAFGGFGAGGFLGVLAVCVDLFL